MPVGPIGAWWTGPDRRTAILVVLWRGASVASALAVVAPIMTVGRRPYKVGRLADRLEAIREMAITPAWLPAGLRWFAAAAIATAVSGLVWPVHWRLWHAPVAGAALVLAVAVWRAASDADLTAPTRQLTIVVAALAVAVAAALVPGRWLRRPTDASRSG